MSVPPRKTIDTEYRWDLSQIFATGEDWDTSCEDLETKIERFESTLVAPPESTTDLEAFLDSIADLYRRKQRLELYATLEQDGTDRDGADERMRRYHDLSTEFESVIAGALRVLQETDDETLDALAVDLDDRRRYLSNLRSQAERRRSSEVETVVGRFSEARAAPDRVIVAATAEDFEPTAVERPDGTRVELTRGRLQRELSNPDRAYRKRAYENFHAELDRFEETIATAYVEKLKGTSALADVRGYDSLRDQAFHGSTYPESGLECLLPTEVHDTMLDAVRGNLGPRRRARRLRTDRLDVDTLRQWDLDVSVVEAPEPEIPYEEARNHIVEAIAPLESDYQDRLEAFLADDRVDVYECEGKRNDIPAYCPSSSEDGAFVMLNYQDDVRTMFYLCHELGHAMHTAHHREGPSMYATCPRPVEEVPSILHELLLVDHCLEEGGALADHARNRLLQFVDGNFYNATMWSAFTHRLATAIENGEDPDAGQIASEFASLQTEFDPVTEFPDRARKNWLNSSLYREPYHFYQYVLGVTGALSVRDLLQSGDLTAEEYRDFLRSTGRFDPVDLFDQLGLDVTSAEPYERAAETFEAYLDEI